MNFARGIWRLFLVSICWYAIGALVVYDAWSRHRCAQKEQKENLNRCLATVGSAEEIYDVNGRPIIMQPARHSTAALISKQSPLIRIVASILNSNLNAVGQGPRVYEC